MSDKQWNNWGVSYSDIKWLESFLVNHNNLGNVSRHKDILFRVHRIKQDEKLRILCLRKYVIGLTPVLQALQEFKEVDIIYIGGGWNAYTTEAKKYCWSQQIGLYRTPEMTGALWRDEFWTYSQKDKKGNPIYFFRPEESA